MTTESPAPARAAALFASLSRLHIVAIGALGALTFGKALTGAWLPAVAAIAALDWFLVNLLNRVVDLDEDRANGIRATELVARRPRAWTVAGLALLTISFPLVHLVAPATTPARLAFHALGLAYNWRLLPGGRRIKALYFWKNFASACGFLLTVFAYPLLTAGALDDGVSPATVALCVAFFLPFEISYEILYDLRDVEGDRLVGARTYPVVHGPAVAERITWSLLAVSAAVLLGGFAAGLLPLGIAIMAAAPAIQALWMRRALPRGVTAADCIGLTWVGAALLATWNVWVHLGLPGAEL